MGNIFPDKKVAVCLSGIPKYWHKSLNSIKNYFDTADIFIHTWLLVKDEINESITLYPHQYQNFDTDINKIIENFNPASIKLDLFNHKKDVFLQKKNNYNNAGIDNSPNISQLSMFYSVQESCRLKKYYEEFHNIIYDIVIRMRFDSDIRYYDTDINIDNNTIIIPIGSDWGPNNLNDQFCISKSSNMDIICSCYDNYDSCINVTKFYQPETNFKEHLVQKNILQFVVRKSIQVGINNNEPILD
jgi:hypothetical protein